MTKQARTITANALQRKALRSPIRLEIAGQFTGPDGLSIADVAERMGRPPASLYYHFRKLEEAGLLEQVGSRPGVKKREAIYHVTASRLEFPATNVDDVMVTTAAAFRMTERDLEGALRSGDARTGGKYRNLFATRMHLRTNKEVLAEINEHLYAIEKLVLREARRKTLPPDADQYLSLTLALLPLHGRNKK